MRMCASCLIHIVLWNATSRTRPARTWARTGSAEWRESGGTRVTHWRDGAGRGPGAWPVAPCPWAANAKWRGVVGRVVARAGQPWILLNADRVSYTKRAGRVSLLLVL